LEQRVVIEMLPADERPEVAKGLRSELMAFARINHPNIIDILDFGSFEEQGQRGSYCVMPFFEGSTLFELLRHSQAGLRVERAVNIIVQACRGLEAMHEKGLIHGNPAAMNIFVTTDNFVKLLPDWHVPGKAPAKPRPESDIFILGVACYEALTGRPIEGTNADLPPVASDVNPDVNIRLALTLQRAMDRDPGSRFATATAFGDALRDAFSGRQEVFPGSSAPAPTTGAGAAAPEAQAPRGPSFFASKLRSLRDWLTRDRSADGPGPDAGETATPQVPDGAHVDNVNFSITAPGSVTPGKQFEFQFWAYLEGQRDVVRARAVEALGESARKKMLFASQGPYPIARGAVLGIRLTLDQMEIAEDSKIFLWTGEIGVAAFVVKVSAGATFGPHAGKAAICVDGVPVGRLDFLLQVKEVRGSSTTIRSELKTHRRAFASYASEDRSQVLARVQGIHKVAPNLAVFIDVLELRSGEYWAQRLVDEIPTHDTFFLFWSRHAMQSTWVEKEWRCAYEKRGLDFIDPIPLEPPSKAPPPAELAGKHFNDPLLAFIT
jgi:hypothetical protein